MQLSCKFVKLISKYFMLSFLIALHITFLDAYTTQIAVNPSTTDASISDRWGENLIMYDSTLLDINNIKVLIYLPGTNGITFL